MNEKLLDTIGWAIIAALQEDARLSFNELARRIGVSPPTIAERVRRMEEIGIIAGYRAVIDPTKVGLPVTAIIRLITPVEQYDRSYDAIRAMPEVARCHRVTGGDSSILTVRVASLAHLEDVIDRLRPIGQSITSLVLSSPVQWRAVTPPPNESS